MPTNSFHDLKLRTWLAYERIEHLLEACCTKVYSMTLENLEETDHGPRKVIRICFEEAADRERFRITFQKSQEEISAPVMSAVLGTAANRA